ncbi:Holliday junction resolvase RuvX [Kroppenstedtia eburnea]|uniref:Putative pre-16S rRNA nuclease n=1 Tax=Kroppenstedtia eburnea TaxID=714067 RepID=A0A1N7KMW3_9BACL|nr:Holliday junction resolvase RuvX [Kroppenstedtia eburnea]QKI82898.1 Holliday junction resolvase RuvX [Kroppenstedtia eburnea]SIS62897.1 putative holliday junction resolvase [Kroppenstedtia eburnea]
MTRIMGLDLGEKRVGVAVSDPMGWTAQGVDVLRRDHPDWLDRLARLIEDYEVEALVVGLPRNMDGSIGAKGEACRQLGRELEERFQIPVELWDERLSTVAVERTLIDADLSRRKRRKVVDRMAASWILQGYLEARRRNRDE